MSTPSPAPPIARSVPAWPAGRPLRAWQSSALEALEAHAEGNFLASATPAAGKTTFGLRVAHDMLAHGRVRRVVVVAPTTHICRQWAAEASRLGVDLEPNRPNSAGREPADRHGISVTYQTLAADPDLHRRGCGRPTLVVADEPHHMGEHAAWGLRMRAAFAGAAFRLLLSGTPFRSDNSAIPWVTYDDEGISRADFGYSYTDALLEGVCRPITFLTYGGEMEWTSDGRRRRATFSVVLNQRESARRLRTALDPEGDWIGQVLHDADARLSAVRAAGHPDAGGLVVAADKDHAAAVAARLGQIAGEEPLVVTSDDPDGSARIASFAAGSRRWLVSVLMVSEGVDIPRLRVGVYATAARTELFFRQVVGRFVRRTPTPRAQMSYLFLPADPGLKALAAQIEEERNHALEERPESEEREAPPERSEGRALFEALSSNAEPDEQITSSARPGDALQLFDTPGDPPPPPPRAVPPAGARPVRVPEVEPRAEQGPEPAYRRRERLRQERNRLVGDISRRTGEAHAQIHGRANRATGAASVAAATVAQLEKANELLGRELRRAAGSR